MSDSVRENSQRKDKSASNATEDKNTTRIMDTVERKTLIPRDQQNHANQGKVWNNKKTKEESNIEAGPTIEMSLTMKGEMEIDEPMDTTETEEDKKIWKN